MGRLYVINEKKRAVGTSGTSAAVSGAGNKARRLFDYDDGCMKAHQQLRAAKAVGLYSEDFYRGFCACMKGFGEAAEAIMCDTGRQADGPI